jgi:hypothetical protein
MLTNLDDCLLHQVPCTFSEAQTSDHRFYDRYYVGMYQPGGPLSLAITIGLYKNMNSADAGAALVRGDRQFNVRCARPLRPAVDEPRIAPLSWSVVRPLQELNFKLDPGDHELSFDLYWVAIAPPMEEGAWFATRVPRVNGRITQDVVRYDQVGRVTGWIEHNGERLDVENWFGMRDHSWGVRWGIGGFEPFTGPTPLRLAQMTNWVVFATDEISGHVVRTEDAAGKTTSLSGLLHWLDGSRADLDIIDAHQELSFAASDRYYRSGRLEMRASDESLWVLEPEPTMHGTVVTGLGYYDGFLDRKGHGAYREPLIEWDTYDLSKPNVFQSDREQQTRPRSWVQQPAPIKLNGRAGMADFSAFGSGELPKYGLSAA